LIASGAEAQARGLTEEILNEILNEELTAEEVALNRSRAQELMVWIAENRELAEQRGLTEADVPRLISETREGRAKRQVPIPHHRSDHNHFRRVGNDAAAIRSEEKTSSTCGPHVWRGFPEGGGEINSPNMATEGGIVCNHNVGRVRRLGRLRNKFGVCARTLLESASHAT
jgi:hypothetical protein